MHRLLRERTQALHTEVEAAFAIFDIRAAEGYRAFLLAQAGAVLPLERWLDTRWEGQVDRWPLRRRSPALLDDLAAMNASAPAFEPPRIEGHPLGVAYVLEGARLGGRVLARRLLDGAAFSPAGAMRFIDGPRDPALWTSLIDQLGLHTSPKDVSRLVDASEAAFAMFRNSADAVALPIGLERA